VKHDGGYSFEDVINGVRLEVLLRRFNVAVVFVSIAAPKRR
jgi:hypothetical protein